ncbi:hypothetical protein D3C76_1527550 [compost metagenome]
MRLARPWRAVEQNVHPDTAFSQSLAQVGFGDINVLTQVFVVFELQSARGAESKGILEELDGLLLIEAHQSRQIRITHAQSATQGGDC